MQPDVTAFFDPQEALSIVDGDEDLFRELVDIFLENYQTELLAVRDAIGRRDAEALRQASHHLKGTLSALAAGPARETAVQMEDMGRNADLGHAEDLYADMEQQLRALDAALKGWA